MLLLFCRHYIARLSVTRLNLKFELSHKKPRMPLDPHIYEATSPLMLCYDSFAYFKRGFTKWETSRTSHTCSFSVGAPTLQNGLPELVWKPHTLGVFRLLKLGYYYKKNCIIERITLIHALLQCFQTSGWFYNTSSIPLLTEHPILSFLLTHSVIHVKSK